MATVEFETADGAVGTGSAKPADQFDTVAKVNAEDCIAEHTFEITSITTGDSLRLEQRGSEFVALLDVTARPTGAQGVTSVATTAPTTLVGPADYATGWNLGWVASAASGPLTTVLEIVPSNCNPHIVAEDKRGTSLAVTLDDGEAGTVFVGVSDEVRGQIYGYIGSYCGW